MGRIYHRKKYCKICKQKLIYDLVETQIYKVECCGQEYIIINEFENSQKWMKLKQKIQIYLLIV